MKKIIGLCLFATTLFTTVSNAQDAYRTEALIGIGATLEKLPDGTVQVDGLISNAPAEHAGLAIGDVIVEVKPLPGSATLDVRGLSLSDIVALIRGPIGVPVEITYTRGQSATAVLSIIRDRFDVEDDE